MYFLQNTTPGLCWLKPGGVKRMENARCWWLSILNQPFLKWGEEGKENDKDLSYMEEWTAKNFPKRDH